MPTIPIENDEHWRRLRAGFGGSSEASALFDHGYANMPSRYSLYALKKGLIDIPFDDDIRVRIGKAIEPALAEIVASEKSWDLRIVNQYVMHEDPDLLMGCTVDRYVFEHEDGMGIVELKNRDFLQWRDNYDETDASDRDKIQLAHQMACHPDVTWGAIGVLVGGSDLKVYVYKREDLQPIIADVENAWRAFWKMYDNNIEPQLASEVELPYWMKATEEKETPLVTDLSGKLWDDLAANFMATDLMAKDATKKAKTMRAQLIQGLNRAPAGFTANYWVNAKYPKVAESVSTRKAHERVNLSIDPRKQPEEREEASNDGQNQEHTSGSRAIDPNILDAG